MGESTGQPVWGTPPSAPAGSRTSYPAEPGAPGSAGGGGPADTLGARRSNFVAAGPREVASLRRRARIALASNLVLAVFCFGLLSIPGAVLAGMALGALPGDVPRATRLLRWSWGFLIADLLFSVLLLVTVGLLGLFLVFAATR